MAFTSSGKDLAEKQASDVHCPYCEATDHSRPSADENRPGWDVISTWTCGKCRRQFQVALDGTIETQEVDIGTT